MNLTPALLGGLASLVDELFTTKEEKANAKIKVMELAVKGDLAQLAVNAAEAKHKSLLVAGWRPFIGWTCGAAFAWAFLLAPIVQTIVVYTGAEIYTAALPELDLATMMPVLLGMLGLGGLRTFEKAKGAA